MVFPNAMLEQDEIYGEDEAAPSVKAPSYVPDDAELLTLAEQYHKEVYERRSLWEQTWMRNIHFVNFRQWIVYISRFNEWRDVRMARHIPRPVSAKPREVLQALRAMFDSVNIGVNVRPNGSDPKNVAVATVADDYAPILHEEHDMPLNLNEAHYWFIVTGNVFAHTFFEKDVKHGYDEIPQEACQSCGMIYGSDEIAEAQNVCPDCGAAEFSPAVGDDGEALPAKIVPRGKGKTIILSPFELLFKNEFSRFEDVPYVIRTRWRDKAYYTSHPTLAGQFEHAAWQKSPSEQSMSMFRSLPNTGDTGAVQQSASSTGSGGSGDSEGLPEYECWVRPCSEFPDGLVFRWAGDSNRIILYLEENEAIPGPIPYKDADGRPLFTYTHAAFEQIGWRVYGTGPMDSIIPIVMELNKLDSHIQMIIGRMSNPLWMIPKGSEIEKFTGEPGLVVKWNPLTVGGNAKPERIAGECPHGSFFTIRDMYEKRIEEAAGTFDIMKGEKPAGVEAFAAMQLLVERSQSRFAPAFKAIGNFYRDWFKFALEIEREFGPDERTKAILSPARTYTMETFKRANLQGSFSIIVEDGSKTPKSSLGVRATVEHLNQMGALNLQDPDQLYKVYQLFGQSGLSPGLDVNMQRALQKQDAFEKWAQDPAAMGQYVQGFRAATQQYVGLLTELQSAGPDPATGIEAPLPTPPSATVGTPLAWKPWYNAQIHRQEFIKWTNGDRIVELLATQPALEPILIAHQQEIEAAMVQQMALMNPQPQQQPGGSGRSMQNSNQEAGSKQVKEGKA